HRKVSDLVADRARAAAPGRLGQAIKARSTNTSASIDTVGTRQAPDALVRFWGTKKRTGWYARPRYENSPKQHPDWVGNQWEPGLNAGSRPYFIGDAIDRSVDGVVDLFDREIGDLTKRAFPD